MALAPFLALGLLQGLAAWWLQRHINTWLWQGAHSEAFMALAYATVALPMAWFLSADGFTTSLARWIFAAFAGVVFAGVGWHAGHTSGLGQVDWVQMALAALVLGFSSVSLATGFDPQKRRFEYARLYELSWRNAVVLGLAGAMTALMWALLVAGAFLLNIAGVDAVLSWLAKPLFAFPATCSMFGLAIGLSLKHAGKVQAFRRACMTMTAGFLPLALVFALAWVATIALSGAMHPLTSSRQSAFSLFWFCALTVTFANAAHQDGLAPPAYPPWLARVLAWAWLSMPVMALYAGCALWLRVAQHGWTPTRLWGALAGVVLTVHTLGYALSLLRPRAAWMNTLAVTNVAAALAKLALLALFISPVADVRRLAVESQVSRLISSDMSVDQFDWSLLANRTGNYGRHTLQALSQQSLDSDEKTRKIAKAAASVIAAGYSSPRPELVRMLRDVKVLPAGAELDPGFLEWLDGAHDWHAIGCAQPSHNCAFWKADIDGDGLEETVLLPNNAGSPAFAVVYARSRHEAKPAWDFIGELATRKSLAEWERIATNGPLKRLPPRWPDLQLDGERVQFQVQR